MGHKKQDPKDFKDLPMNESLLTSDPEGVYTFKPEFNDRLP
mgnify:CR=1 FL=1